MSLTGTIIELKDSTAVVEVSPKPECKGCHACTGLLGDKKSATRQLEVPLESINVKVGDQVVLDLEPGHGSIAALLIFGMPILAFFLGIWLTPWICNGLELETSDLARVITGFLAMGVSFVLLAIFSRSSAAKALSMKIVKKL